MTVNFLVCVLCLQALVVPPSVELSAPFLTSGVRWRGGSHTGMITPIDHGGKKKREDIKGVCHANVPRAHLFCFSFKSLFMWHTLSHHSHLEAAHHSICWWVSAFHCRVHQSYRLELVLSSHRHHFS